MLKQVVKNLTFLMQSNFSAAVSFLTEGGFTRVCLWYSINSVKSVVSVVFRGVKWSMNFAQLNKSLSVEVKKLASAFEELATAFTKLKLNIII